MRCALAAGCEAVATARVAVSRRPSGAIGYLTVVPFSIPAAGGQAACADHLHAQIDGLLMASLGETTPPAREQMPPENDGQAGQ